MKRFRPLTHLLPVLVLGSCWVIACRMTNGFALWFADTHSGEARYEATIELPPR